MSPKTLELALYKNKNTLYHRNRKGFLSANLEYSRVVRILWSYSFLVKADKRKKNRFFKQW